MKDHKITTRWTCKDGSKIRICDMTDSHLVNTINMLRRYAENARSGVSFPSFNGEMVQFYAEQEYDNLQDAHIDNIACEMFQDYELLCDEAFKRTMNVEW